MLPGRSSAASRTRALPVCGHKRPRAPQPARASATATRGAAQAAFAVAPALVQPPVGAFFNSSLGAFLGFAVAPFARLAYKKLFGRRRAKHRATPSMQGNAAATFSVATFNLRGVMDRWQERQPLLRQCIHQIDADVLCFQECLTGEFGQDKRVLPAWYHVFPCKAALFNLAQQGGLLQWYAHTVERMLGVPPVRRLMVRLPAAVEAWRERLTLKADLFRNIRDLAMAPFFGNSVACRIAEAQEIRHSTLILGDWRAAQRIEFYIGREGDGQRQGNGGGEQQESSSQACGGRTSSGSDGGGSDGEHHVVTGSGGFKVWVVNTHLDHDNQENRQRQALAMCEWIDQEKADCAAIILCGDFNGAPHETFHAVLRRLGYVSAHAQLHGREPQGTWPTGIQAPLMDKGDFECLDYIYIWTAPDYDVKVLSAEVHGLQPAAHDKTLYPSDHAAIKATLQVSGKQPVDLQAAAEQGQQQQQLGSAASPTSSL